MEKKLVQMNEAFEHLRFTDCLIIIDQLLKKYTKPDKKNKCLTEEAITIIKCYKSGCLASLGKYHEADSIQKEIMNPESIKHIAEEQTMILAAISELFGDGRENKTIQMLEQHVPKHNKSSLYRFQLSTRNFASLSKSFLKEYMTTKNVSWQFGQVYLEYLQHLDKAGMIQYKRDGWYKHNDKLKMGLKMVSMFLEKTVKNVQDILPKHELQLKQAQITTNKQPIESKIKALNNIMTKSSEFKLKIAINEGRAIDAIKLFGQMRSSLKFPFTFIRSIFKLRDVTEKAEIIDEFYINQMQTIFQTNLNFNHYTPWYDYYNQFLQIFLQKAQSEDKQFKTKTDLKQDLIPFEQLYKFNTIKPVQIISKYFKSLSSQFHLLTDQKSQNFALNKKSDYYKICLKGLLLQLIKICHVFSLDQTKLKYLRTFKDRFANTLTFAHQMKDYWEILIRKKIVVRLDRVQNDNQLIEQINFHKIQIGVSTKIPDQQGFQSVYSELSLLYKIRVKQVQKNRKLEKGQRYLSDQFYTLICDYARAFIETQQTFEPIFKVLSFLIKDLESVIEASPYNADTKLRLMQFFMLLGYGQKLIEVYFTNDIKSVQWESLGFWFLRIMMEVGVTQNYEPYIDKFVKSYQQNQRQTSQYGLKALKAGELDRVDEYLCYRTCILHSYNSIILLYSLFHRYRFESHSQFYITQINERLSNFKKGQNELYFNADFKVMKNQIFRGADFTDIYGIFNNLDILQLEINIYQHEQVSAWRILAKECEQTSKGLPQVSKLEERINSTDIKSLFDFSKYTFQEGEPHFDEKASRYTVVRNTNYLNMFALVGRARISAVILTNELNSLSKGNEVSKQLLEEMREKLMKNIKQLVLAYGQIQYRSQLHTITLIRRGLFESYGLLNLIKQTVQKNKKMKFAKETVNSLCEPSLEYILEVIVTLRWSKQDPQQLCSLRKADEGLQRQLSMDLNQAKRTISKYQSHYKA